MLKRPLLLLLLIAMVTTAASCIFDPDKPTVPDDPPPVQKFLNLTEMWHVLNNVEVSYNQRNIGKYEELLDDDFTFFLSTGDVGEGLPESWGTPDEIRSNANLFSTDQPPAPLKRVLRISMDIAWEDEDRQPNLAWIDFVPPNSTETWYTTTVTYDFKFDLEGDLTYVNNPGSQAQFTVRNAGTDEAPEWRLVEFRDLGNEN